MDQACPDARRRRGQVLGSVGVDSKSRGLVLLGAVDVVEGGGIHDPVWLDAAHRLFDHRGVGDVERRVIERMQRFPVEDIDQVVSELTVRSGDEDVQRRQALGSAFAGSPL